MSFTNTRLCEEPVSQQLNVITKFVGIKNLKTLVNFIAVIIYEGLPGRHRVYSCV